MPYVALAIVVILAIVTLVGHGLWLLLAALFGRRSGRTCPFCHRRTVRSDRCDHCQRALESRPASELDDLAAVERQLGRFRARGTLKPAVVDQMLQRLQAYRQGLTAPGRPDDEIERARRPILQPTEAEAVEILPDTPEAGSGERGAGSGEQGAGSGERAVPAAHPTPPPFPRPAQAQGRATQSASNAIRVQTRDQGGLPPPRNWPELLAGFMEEKNIHWGELVGGLLIVCCSAALVISFWEHFKQNLYLQSFIFVTVSAAIFGVGLYAYHRWKLVSTGRGLLIIATLLVPLNLVAMAALSKENWSPAMAAVEAVSLAIFAWLVGLATGVLAPRSRWLTVVGVVGNSAALTLTARLVTPGSGEWHFSLAAACCVGLFAVAVGGGLYQTVAEVFSGSTQAGRLRDGARIRLDAAQTLALLTMLGLTAFALAVSAGMLVERASVCFALPMLLHRLGLLLSLAALPALAVGLTVQHGVARDAEHSGYRVAGTAVALVALTVMLVSLGLAWPHPHWIMAVGGLDALILATAAVRWRMPVLHAGAIAAAALAYLAGFHYFFGHYYGDLPAEADAFTSLDLLRLSISARSGTGLTGLFVLSALAAELLVRRGLRRQGRVYLGGCASSPLPDCRWSPGTPCRGH